MGRLIDQDDVLMCLTGDITGMDIKDYIKMVATNIKALPSAQPTIEPRVRSKWWHYEDILQCCNCSAEFYDDIVEYTGDDVPKFCPNCGADMRGEQDG